MFPILILILILIVVNAFFAASEMALVSIKPSDLYQITSQGKKNAAVLEKVTKDSTKYLSTIQVAIFSESPGFDEYNYIWWIGCNSYYSNIIILYFSLGRISS